MYHLFRFAALGVASIFLLSFLPFVRRGGDTDFWHFNRIVGFRIVLAGALGAVLFAGLALALAALDNLFGVTVIDKRYFELWILVVGLFVVPFTLAGIPANLSKLNEVTEYPRVIKVLGQYLLTPLVVVYFVILYAYIAKIAFAWSWPQGWVGRLILGFSATGILAHFLLDPLREKREILWIQKAARWYYLILLPLVVILFLALWRRISEYGLTEDRYLGLALGVWLAFMALYFLSSRSKSIKMIPASLFVFALLSSVGPWGMFSVAEQSQVRRLRGMLEADSILVNAAIQKAPAAVSTDHSVEISAILSYLHEVHGYGAIEPWFAESLRTDDAGAGHELKSPEYVAGLMGVEFLHYRTTGREKYFSVSVDLETAISTSGYDRLLRVELEPAEVEAYSADSLSKREIWATADTIRLSATGDSAVVHSLAIPLRPLFEQLATAHARGRQMPIPTEVAEYYYETNDFRVKIVMLRAHLGRQADSLWATYYDALLLYSRKRSE